MTYYYLIFVLFSYYIKYILGQFSQIHGLVTATLLPEIALLFNINEDYLKVEELFIAKYEYREGKQNKLDAHMDGTPYSFVIALNDPKTGMHIHSILCIPVHNICKHIRTCYKYILMYTNIPYT